MNKREAKRIIKELKCEISKTLFFFCDMDIEIYDCIRTSTFHAFHAQQVFMPKQLHSLLDDEHLRNLLASHGDDLYQMITDEMKVIKDSEWYIEEVASGTDSGTLCDMSFNKIIKNLKP